MVEKVACFMVTQGVNMTSEGNWNYGVDELSDEFGESEEWFVSHSQEIKEAVETYPQISAVDFDTKEESFSLYFFLDFCSKA